MRSTAPVVGVVVPCFNEEEALPLCFSALAAEMASLKEKNLVADGSFLLFVDDGSVDKTWKIIEELPKYVDFPQVKGLKLSRNFGHQQALLAGMLHAKDHAECVITVDADLQDDLGVMTDMLQKYLHGTEIVFGVRNKRDVDSAFKRLTAKTFYKIQHMFGIDTIPHHADYRLVGPRALQALSEHKEQNLFLRGMFPFLGFKQEFSHYERKERSAGESKYPIYKMMKLAADGITSFSIVPLRIILVSGFFISIISLVFGFWALWTAFRGHIVPGWSSTVVPLFFLGGVQMLFLGVLGEYIGKIYLEVKARPRFIVEKVVN